MSTGAVLQLAAYGTQDLFLTGNPQITHFKAVIKRHTNFAMELSENYFDGKVAPGQKVSCKVERIGDLIHDVYLKLELPEIQALDGEDNVYTSWVNAIGYMIINRVEIQIGNRIIDRHYGQWMNIWSELTTNVSKKDVLNEMVGKKNFFTSTSQNGPLELYVPLQFWFCNDLGSALPLVAIQRQDIFINVEFNPFEMLWTSNIDSVACNIIDDDIEFNSATLLINYIFLDEDERRYFAQNKHYYLIEQLQIISESIDDSKDENIFDMSSFNHPVKELIWTIQGVNVKLAKQWDNYSGKIITLDEPIPDPPMTDAIIRFEGVERFERRNERYFRLVVPYKYHTYTPVDNFIYIYSFATKPEILQPTGTANFSRIDNPTLHIRGDQSLGKADINIYARNYNILRIIDGITGILFAN